MPSLNPDIRRAAADQLVTLTPDPRFAHALSDPALLQAMLNQLTTSNIGLGNGGGPDYSQLAHAQMGPVSDMTDMNALAQGQGRLQQQDHDGFSMQLMVTCLQLLVALVQHCQEARGLLLQGSGRSDKPPN